MTCHVQHVELNFRANFQFHGQLNSGITITYKNISSSNGNNMNMHMNMITEAMSNGNMHHPSGKAAMHVGIHIRAHTSTDRRIRLQRHAFASAHVWAQGSPGSSQPPSVTGLAHSRTSPARSPVDSQVASQPRGFTGCDGRVSGTTTTTTLALVVLALGWAMVGLGCPGGQRGRGDRFLMLGVAQRKTR